jgi:hypothetical protein
MGAICARRRELTIFNFSEDLALMLVITMETCHVPHMFKLNSKLFGVMVLWLAFGHALQAQETPTAPEKPSD